MSKKILEFPFTAATTNDQTTSFKAILQQLNNKTKKETTPHALRTSCKQCGMEIFPTRLCGGHSGGGTDDTQDETSEKEIGQSLTAVSEKTFARQLISEVSVVNDDPAFSLVSDEEDFNLEVIESLIAEGLLQIAYDRQSMTFHMKLTCEPNSLPGQQRQAIQKIMNACLAQWHQFKEENHLSDQCSHLIQDEEGNPRSLHIVMPTEALYDEFIQRLTGHLPSILSSEMQEKECFSP